MCVSFYVVFKSRHCNNDVVTVFSFPSLLLNKLFFQVLFKVARKSVREFSDGGSLRQFIRDEKDPHDEHRRIARTP